MARSNIKKYEFVYKDPFACEDFDLFRSTYGAVPVSLMEVVTTKTKAQCMVQDI